MRTLLETAESVFRVIIEEARDFAVILVDQNGRIELCNRGAEDIFGFAAGELVGREFAILFTEEDRAAGIPERELALARETGRAEDARWHQRGDGRRFFADGVTSAVRGGDGRLIGFSKITRDLTARYLTEQRLAAQLALTNLLNEEQPFATTARRIMQTICESLGWDMGGLWRVVGDRIRCVEVWHEADLDSTSDATLCDGRAFARGEGLPGRVWQLGEAVWLASIPPGSDAFPRAGAAARLGMRSAFAFPIAYDGEVRGVLEFFSRREREPEQALLPIMTLVGAQIGDHIERRHTLQTLAQNEERYRVMSETAQDAIFTIDEESTVLFCNSAVERVFGYSREELVGQKLDIVIPERYREAHRHGLQRYLRTREKHIPWTGVELPALHKDGHEFPCEISFGVWGEDAHLVFTGFARDITERKRAREELEQSLADAEASRAQLERRAEEEASFRHLASALTGAIEMTDVLLEITNRATQVTRADGVYVERIVGKGQPWQVEVVASQGRGAPPRGLRVSYPGSLTEEILKNKQPVILTDMSGFGGHMAPYLMDTCAKCQVLVTPLVAESEALGALVLLNSGQSGRHFGDADVVRARTLGDMTSLALRRVRLLEQEREAKEKAEAAVRVRDETLGIVSHDLRNPLTQIGLSADLLPDASPEEQRELIETIRGASRQAQRLIQDLLDVARLEAGRFSVQKVEIETEPVVRDACESHEQMASQRKQRIVCNIASPLPKICGDRDRLLQVFGNLIGNAIKFTPERGTIAVEAETHGNDVEFRVRDTGPGIPEADVKNLFRPYWQAKKTAHMGAGLGLAIVRGIVEAHGGKVWADNASGGGALFTFTIPVR
ncbi:MAG TPA: PAS domain S-box protein [Thermoanaerobaculia bacterium]|jgi:PAS domain S-box-containing protein